MQRALVPLLLAVCGLVPSPTSAAASTTFGANLALPANNTLTCGNAFPFAQGASSCLSYSVNPTSYAPFSGVVNTVRVKTGDFAQGPMQVVVLRSYYQNNPPDPGHPNFYCCFVQEYGPTFTPNRNAITAVPVTLGMVEDATPPPSDGNTVAKGDFLGLSVLTGDVPIPISKQDSSAYAGFYAPAPREPDMTPSGLGGSQGSASGYTVLLNADIDPVDGGGGGGGGGAPGGGGGAAPGGGTAPAPGAAPLAGGPAAPITFPATGGRLTGGDTAAVPLICRLTTACDGRLTLRDRAPAAGARAARAAKPRVLGTARFSIASGKQKAIKVKLNAFGRKLVRHAKKVTLYAATVVAGRTTSQKVTLKAAK